MRNYKKQPGSRPYLNLSEENLKKAISERLAGGNLVQVAEKYGVPKSTLDRKAKQKNMKKHGGQCALNSDEEKRIVENIQIASKWGFPLTSLYVRNIVKQYLDKRGIQHKTFVNNMPGRDWMRGFLSRHKAILSERWCQNIKTSRSQVNSKVISEYFVELERSLEGVEPAALVNFDETNMTDDPSRKKVFTRRGSKHAYQIMDTSKSSNSVMFAGAASGDMLPVYVVFKAEHLYDSWVTGGPSKARYNRSKSGWFTLAIFEDWFETVALPYFRKFPKESPKALVGDNLSSHLSVTVIDACKEWNIRFIPLPPNSTHVCQPLDVAYFRSLKSEWREVLRTWKQKNRGQIPKDKFAGLLKIVLDRLDEKGKSESNMKAGFKSAGLHPLNPEAVLKNVPEIEQENDEMNSTAVIMDNAFEIFLKNLYREETVPRRQAKKRIQLKPGQSIRNVGNASDENSNGPPGADEPDPATSSIAAAASTSSNKINEPVSKKRRRNLKALLDESSASEEDAFSLHDSSSSELRFDSDSEQNSDEEHSYKSQDEEEELPKTLAPVDFSSLKKGIYIIVTFDYKGKKGIVPKKFVGEIIEVLGNEKKIKCTFMRSSLKDPTIFVFPEEVDEAVITYDQVLKVVTPSFIRRGRYRFPVNLFKD